MTSSNNSIKSISKYGRSTIEEVSVVLEKQKAFQGHLNKNITKLELQLENLRKMPNVWREISLLRMPLGGGYDLTTRLKYPTLQEVLDGVKGKPWKPHPRGNAIHYRKGFNYYIEGRHCYGIWIEKDWLGRLDPPFKHGPNNNRYKY